MSEHLFKYFKEIRTANPQIERDIIKIMTSSGKLPDGMSIAELQRKYKELTGRAFPIDKGQMVINQFMLNIPMIAATRNENGDYVYFYFSERNDFATVEHDEKQSG